MLLRILVISLCLALNSKAELSDKDLDSIGHRVWQNECAGTRDGLTSWNSGENFASLGIGHFIWYPRGVTGPFEESFPKLIKYLGNNGAAIPAWLHTGMDCPWSTYRLRGSSSGTFALIDYVNFKGEGVKPSERYKGEGWGLLDVLTNMEQGNATQAFARSASSVLERRVKNAPPERNESRWLAGWKARVRSYAD